MSGRTGVGARGSVSRGDSRWIAGTQGESLGKEKIMAKCISWENCCQGQE